MFEQDYIMRMIKELVRTILKLLFNMDTENPTTDLLKDNEAQSTFNYLLDMVDNGDINAAENQIYEMTTDGNMANLELALLFYSYLNDKDEKFLKEHHFSREEIKFGIEELISRYGLTGVADIFLADM